MCFLSKFCGDCDEICHELSSPVMEPNCFKDKTEPQEVLSADIRRFIKLFEDEYNLAGDFYGNGCIHGFKPSKSCPNEDCKDREMHLLYEKIMGI
jgi:hypothetical protein